MIVATVDAVTDVVETVKVALVAFAGTVTLAGTVAAAALLDSATANPPAGAAAVNVTVPCADAPPATLVGLTDTAESAAAGGGGGAGVTVSDAVLVAPPNAPVIVTGVDAPTALVVTVNVALVAPAAIVTLAGTLAAAALLLESDTAAPPLGAAALKVTVPVEELPPTTLVGLTVTAASAADGGGATGGSTVNATDLEPVGIVAVIVTVFDALTEL
ncbi:MAG TPA: hypothetical protein VG370_21745 [Chloroflexota bacterium]|nr:hypothetical protein [Chloroflexota bacterium]